MSLESTVRSLVVAGAAAGALLLASRAPTPLSAQNVPTSQVCISCHLGLKDPKLSEPARDFPKDIHAEKGFGCLDCHGAPPGGGPLDPAKGFLHAPARKDIPAMCGRCHSDAAFMKKYDPSLRVDQVQEYWTSDHGRRLKELNDPDVATCADCHQIHRIRPPSDPTANTYPLNVPTTCGKCHADPKRMAKHHLPTDQLEKYKKSVHGQLLYKKGDLSAPVCNDCHGNHGAQPPGVSSVEYVCGQCHTVMEQFFDENGHKKAFAEKGLPGCATCHGHHDIEPVSDSILLVRQRKICAQCHAPGDPNGQQFAKMAEDLDSLTTSLAESRSLLEKAQSSGMEVSQAIFELDDVKNAFSKARSAVHSFKAAEVQKEVDAGLNVTRTGLKRGQQAMQEHAYRREGLAVSAALILLLIASLLMRIHYTEGQDREIREAVETFYEERLRLPQGAAPIGDDVRLAACAVLLEAAAELTKAERARLRDLARTQFGIARADADRLIEVIEAEREMPGDSGRLSTLLAERSSADQLRAIIEQMWLLAFADHVVARREVTLLEAVSKLLHLEPDEVAAARRQAGVPPGGGRGWEQGREDQ